MMKFIQIGYMILIGVFFVTIMSGCSSFKGNGDNPVFPSDTESFNRQGMTFFNGTETIFGDGDDPGSDVDLASIV